MVRSGPAPFQLSFISRVLTNQPYPPRHKKILKLNLTQHPADSMYDDYDDEDHIDAQGGDGSYLDVDAAEEESGNGM